MVEDGDLVWTCSYERAVFVMNPLHHKVIRRVARLVHMPKFSKSCEGRAIEAAEWVEKEAVDRDAGEQ
jgi:hypothetical protein